MMKRRDFLLASAGGLVAAPFVKTSAFAVGYPEKPVRWLTSASVQSFCLRNARSAAPSRERFAVSFT